MKDKLLPSSSFQSRAVGVGSMEDGESSSLGSPALLYDHRQISSRASVSMVPDEGVGQINLQGLIWSMVYDHSARQHMWQVSGCDPKWRKLHTREQTWKGFEVYSASRDFQS